MEATVSNSFLYISLLVGLGLSTSVLGCGAVPEVEDSHSTTRQLQMTTTSSISLPASVDLGDVAVAAVNGTLEINDRATVNRDRVYYPTAAD